MCISTEIASIFPVPIMYTPIQKINDIYCYNHAYLHYNYECSVFIIFKIAMYSF